MAAMLGYAVGLPEILVVAALFVLLFGAKKLPELAKGMGQAIKEFRHGIKEIEGEESSEESVDETTTKEE